MNLKPFAAHAATAITMSGAAIGTGTAGIHLAHITEPGSILTWGLVVGTAIGWVTVRSVDRLMEWAHGLDRQVVIECPDPDCDVVIAATRQSDDRTAYLMAMATDHAMHGTATR